MKLLGAGAGVRRADGLAAAVPSDGANGRDGSNGANGWTAMLIPETDGARTIMRVDWTGGSGAKPATGYLGAAGTAGALVARADAFDFNPARVETQRVKVDGGGALAVPYKRAYPVGQQPNVQLTVEAPKGAAVRYTAQLDGQPGSASCDIKVFRDGQASLGATLTSLLNIALVVNAPSVWVHVSIIPPAIPIA